MDNYMVSNFELYFPCIAQNMTQYYETDRGELVVKLKNGETLLYDDIDRTIRTLPRNGNSMSEEECLTEFGKRLHKIMYRKGVTQEELSFLTGITQTTISKYITGRACPSFYRVDKIAKALDCSIDDLRYVDEFDEEE